MSICFTARGAIEWFSEIDPIIFRVGAFSVHWYALSYVLGMLFVYWYVGKVGKYHASHPKFVDSLISWVPVGAILGGRVAYVLLYNRDFYFEFPLETLKIWHGGMSFHGGFAGVIISTVIVCRRYGVPLLLVTDLYACSAPLGLFLGRISNLINGELYGKVTDVCWGVIFPNSSTLLPRHPSQVYEALLEGLLLLILTNVLFHFGKLRRHSGALSGIFSVSYGVARCAVELVREPDIPIGYIALDTITMGQVLSFPLIIIGLWLIIRVIHRSRQPSE